MTRPVLLTHVFTQALPDGREVDVSVTFSGYYDPGRTYGPPESCWPPEGKVNIHSIQVELEPTQDFDEWAKKVGLSEKDIAGIEDRLMEQIQEAQSQTEED
jgi:hypothetical protein